MNAPTRERLAAEARGKLADLAETLRRLREAVTTQADAEAVHDAACWLDLAKAALNDVEAQATGPGRFHAT